MSWGLLGVGGACSVCLMLPLAAKWKLPTIPAVVGIASATLMAAVPFLWVYPLCETEWGLVACVFAQAALTFALGLSLMLIRFFRDPDRVPPEADGVVLSPADGEVLYVRTVAGETTPVVTKRGRSYRLSELTGSELVEGPVQVIGVEMTFLDVHVTRCPTAGRVRLLKHIKGEFLSLRREESPFVNERHTTVIESPSMVGAVVQVASRLVRRVESFLAMGETVRAGQRLGMIRFGSLVAVVLPKSAGLSIEVAPGDRVTAGVSVLARLGGAEGERIVEA